MAGLWCRLLKQAKRLAAGPSLLHFLQANCGLFTLFTVLSIARYTMYPQVNKGMCVYHLTQDLMKALVLLATCQTPAQPDTWPWQTNSAIKHI